MKEFPIDKDSWYSSRDDRTNRIIGNSVESYSNISIGIIVSKCVVRSFSGQIMCFVSLNIMARWCRNMVICIEEDYPLTIGAKDGNLKANLEELVEKIDPYGNFMFDSDIDQCDFKLIIGQSNLKDAFWLDGNGWITGVGYGKSNYKVDYNDRNIIGPAFAACLGVAELFRHVVTNIEITNNSKWYSLYDFQSSSYPLNLVNPILKELPDFGVIHQIGFGAVGSSLSYLLSLSEFQGDLHVIDFDKIEMPNCCSSLAFKAIDAVHNLPKVSVLDTVMKSSSINSFEYEMDYSYFIKNGFQKSNPPDLILCLANERNIWSTIQHNYPPIVLHATTNSSWGINYGRHVPLKEWCIVCRFQSELESKLQPPCGTGIFKVASESKNEHLGTLPFLSPASAVVLLSEMVKLALIEKKEESNFVAFSLKPEGGGHFIRQHKTPSPQCQICSNQNKEIHFKYARHSRYWEK